MCEYIYLLDISKQLAYMKLGSRGKYQPMQYCWVHTSRLLGYLVRTCHLPIDIQQIYCSTQTGQHSRLQCSCCPVWVLQPIHAICYTSTSDLLNMSPNVLNNYSYILEVWHSATVSKRSPHSICNEIVIYSS